MKTVVFLTYNILDGGVGRENELVEIIAAQDADVILLQEVAAGAFVQGLAERLGMQSYVAAGNDGRAIALLTRLRLAAAETFRPALLRHTLLQATLETAPGQTFSLFGVHLAAPAFSLWVEWYRLRELRLILDYIARVSGERTVVAGDFNSIAPGDAPNFRELPLRFRLAIFLHGGYFARQVIGRMRGNGFTDAFHIMHPNALGYTFPAYRADTRFDYFFVNERLRGNVRACAVVTQPESVKRASDHLPVRMELEV